MVERARDYSIAAELMAGVVGGLVHDDVHVGAPESTMKKGCQYTNIRLPMEACLKSLFC